MVTEYVSENSLKFLNKKQTQQKVFCYGCEINGSERFFEGCITHGDYLILLKKMKFYFLGGFYFNIMDYTQISK